MAYSHETGRQFWYTFDKRTKYNQAFMQIVISAGAGTIQTLYRDSRAKGTFPAAFSNAVSPRRNDWITLAQIQTDTVQEFLGSDWSDVQLAFEDFGQGVLLDQDPERQANNDSIHLMDIPDDTNPPIGYHRWHASIRAIQQLGIGEPNWWEHLDCLVGLAWAIQSFARPKQQTVPNPTISAVDLQDLRATWIGLSPERRDRQYDASPGPSYHPSPKQPFA
jgi:hypothetical protein